MKNYLCSGAYIGFLKGGQIFAGHTKGPNMFSCFSTVKQKQTQKNKIVSVDQGAPFLRMGGPGCNRTPAPWASPPLLVFILSCMYVNHLRLSAG